MAGNAIRLEAANALPMRCKMERKLIEIRAFREMGLGSPSTVERRMRDEDIDPPFPRPVRHNPGARRKWYEDEVVAWRDELPRVEYEKPEKGGVT
jgi:predicted DNA-binding transcriptional regulator AlpA